ncbi:MAG: hypothetical protein LC104_01200, partial [Bacteroidales bacterium]|nr:hypothetical protein [Bacteroidales bacterium]
MDKLLLCAFNMWRARQPSEQMNVTIVTDDPIRFDGRNCQHILNRWDWVTVGCYYAIGNGEVDIPNIAGIHSEKSCVLAAVADPELLATLSDQCNQHGVRIFAPTYAPVNTLDNDMIREVAHFDYEFGAKNEWDGAPAQFPIPTLQ